MFDRNKNKPATPGKTAEATPPESPKEPVNQNPASTTTRSGAMIGPSIVIKGTVSGDEDLVVQGRVEGTIVLESNVLSVGQSGKVAADITAKTVNIDGEVKGDITGKEKVIISKSGNVKGNIVAPRVTLEDGAIFKGSIDMDPGDTGSGKVSLASEKPADKSASTAGAPAFDLKSG
jgi:cytoskeletal protein CcmA (bactofilin family)